MDTEVVQQIVGPHGRHLFALIDDFDMCECDNGNTDDDHLRLKGARWPNPFPEQQV